MFILMSRIDFSNILYEYINRFYEYLTFCINTVKECILQY